MKRSRILFVFICFIMTIVFMPAVMASDEIDCTKPENYTHDRCRAPTGCGELGTDTDRTAPNCCYVRQHDDGNFYQYVILKLTGPGHHNIELSRDSGIAQGFNIQTGPGSGSVKDADYHYDTSAGVYSYTLNIFATQNSFNLITEHGVGQGCPDRLMVCIKDTSRAILNAWFNSNNYYQTDVYIFRDALTQEEISAKASWFWSSSTKKCFGVNHWEIRNEEYREYEDILYNECSTYGEYMWVMEESLKTDPDCNTNTSFIQLQNELKALCDNYSSSANYAGDAGFGTAAKACMTSCSRMRQDVALMCGVEFQTSTGLCNTLGEKLLAWMFRFIRIIRYIVPALLILLGVMDFIKAIISQSDDEIKKAGSRFSKRLLAAGIVFIVPLILQFVFGMFNLPGLDPDNPFCELSSSSGPSTET